MSAPANEVLNPLAKELNEKIGAAAPEMAQASCACSLRPNQ